MTLFTGTGERPGVAIAAAARLRVNYGVATFEPERLRRVAARLRAFGVEMPEPEQIILVADTLPPGFAATATGLEVVGLALGGDTPPMPPPDRPAVFGLGDDFFDSVAEGDIVIVDGSRGRVYVGPDASVIARYQAPTRHARRIFLEGAHLPARTASDNRPVSVFASAVSLDDVKRAMEAGADGLFLSVESALLGSDAHPMGAAEQSAALLLVMQMIGGLPLLLHVPPERLSLTALSRASAEGPVSLLVNDDGTDRELQERLAEIEVVYEADDTPFGTPQFELALPATDEDDAPLPETLDGFTGVCAVEALSDARMERLLMIAGLSRRAHKPLLLALGEDWTSEMPTALLLGAPRLLVPAAAVPDVKDTIRAW